MSLPERIGRYEILERVGRGGMGVVYRGRDPHLNREVAIKVLASDLDADETARSRFEREGTAAARLQHPNIVTVFEFGEEQGSPFIVMEFLHGCSLAVLLAGRRPGLLQALDIGRQLCAGLEYAHRHDIVHRDVKPANVWLQDDGAVKLLDFGTARVAASALTRHGEVVGTAPYLAPERIRGLPADGRADIFSTGVIVFELLAGRRPFEAESPTAVINLLLADEPAPLDALPPSVPSAVRQAVGRALEKSPDRRYARAADFGSDLHMAALELQLNEPTIVLGGATAILAEGTPTLFVDGARTLVADGPPTLPADGTRTLLADGTPPRRPADGDTSLPLRPQPPASISPLDLPLAVVPVPPAGDTRGARRGSRVPGILAAAVVLALVLATAAVIRTGSRSGTSTRTPPAPVPGPAATLPGIDGAPSSAADTTASPEAAGGRRTTENPDERGETQATGRAGAVSRTGAVGRTVTLVVRGSYPFEVVTREGTSPANDTHELTVGAGQTIRLRSPEVFLDQRVALAPRPGRQEISAPDLGTLEVRTTSALESCLVAIRGREVDYPTGLRVSVVAGDHLVSLVGCPDGQTRREQVTVAAGGLTQVRFR